MFFTQICFSATSPLIVISDEFKAKGEFSTSIYSSLYIKNSNDYFKRNINNEDYLSRNFNYIVISPSIRYGFNSNLLILSSISSSYTDYSSISKSGSYESKNNFNFDSFSLGFLYKIKSDSEWNKVVGFNTLAVEDFSSKKHFFKTFNARLLFDKTFDPLVASFNLGFQYSNDFMIGNLNYEPSNYIYIKPKIDFLANSMFALGVGTELKFKTNEKFNDYVVNNTSIENNLLFSVSHTIDKKKRVFFDSTFDTSGNSGGSFSFGIDMDH